MKLTIIEPDYHAEVLNNLCIMLSESDLDVTVITKQEIYNQLDFTLINELSFAWRVCPSGHSFKHYFKSNFSEIDRSDVVFFNTLASEFRFFSGLNFSSKVVLRIHNANTFFAPKQSIEFKLTPYFIYKDISHLVRKNLFEREIKYRNKFLSNVDYLSLPDETITKYCINKRYIEESRLTPLIPLTFNQRSENKRSNKINITIPGAIDERRKDYDLLFKALSNIKAQLNESIVINLLGRPKGPYGKRIISLFKGLNSKKIAVNTFSERVSESTFSKIMSGTNFLVLPLVANTRFHIYREVYGKTKMSGAINDIIRFGKPALISDNVTIPELQGVTRPFHDVEDLSRILLEWINNGDYLKVDKDIFQSYLLDKQQQKLEKAFKSLL